MVDCSKAVVAVLVVVVTSVVGVSVVVVDGVLLVDGVVVIETGFAVIDVVRLLIVVRGKVDIIPVECAVCVVDVLDGVGLLVASAVEGLVKFDAVAVTVGTAGVVAAVVVVLLVEDVVTIKVVGNSSLHIPYFLFNARLRCGSSSLLQFSCRYGVVELVRMTSSSN